jgi:hypothetical protein
MQPNAAAGLGFVLLIVAVVLLVVLVIGICYLLTLQKALERVAPRNRLMEPWQVWLMLIPCFNLIWAFFIATKLPDSLRNEFRDRGRDDGGDYGKSIAMTRAVLGAVGVVLNGVSRGGPELAQVGGCVGLIIGLVDLVLFIVFWVKIANYSSQLATDDYGGGDVRRAFDRYGADDRDYPPRGPSTPDTYRPDDDPRYTP